MKLKKIVMMVLAGICLSAAADGVPPSLQELRSSIDAVDDEILILLNERQYYAKQIGELKRLENRPVQDGKREKEIIHRLQNSPSEYLSSRQIDDIWTTLMIISKQAQ